MDPNVYRNPEKEDAINQQKYILMSYKKKKAENYNMKYNDLISLISKDNKLDINFVDKTISKYERSQKMLSNKTPMEKKSISKFLDHLKLSSIRKKIHDIWLAGQVPTIENIISKVNIDPNLPRINRSNMEKILKNLKMNTVALSGIFALIEDDEVVRRRRNYLENIRKYRNEGRPIYFLGDTLIDANENNNNTEVNETQYSCTSTSEAQSEKRKKFIILHIGSAEGFVQGSLDGLESKRNFYDYNHDINKDTFMNWFKKVLPLLKENAVIVMNCTSFNSTLKVYPDKTWKNHEIIEWLVSKGQVVSNDMIKVQLIDLVNEVKSANSIYLIDEIANENRKTVLRTPSFHSELNAIEMAWDIVKRHINTNSVPASKVINIEKLIMEGIDLVTPVEWHNIVENTIGRETDLWNVDTRINVVCDTCIPSTMVKNIPKSSNNEMEFILSKFQSTYRSW